MKSAKLQAPSSREASSTKHQAVPLVDGWHSLASFQPLVLKDEANRGTKPRHAFDLEERTTAFGEAVVRFSKKIPRHPTNDRLISQLVGCGTSIGANYCEANEGVSKKDFRCRIGTCVKEAKETKYFLRMNCGVGAATGRASPRVVSRGEGVTSHFRQYLPEVKMKAPTSELQAPEKLQTLEHVNARRAVFGGWFLVFLWCLDVEAWSFVL